MRTHSGIRVSPGISIGPAFQFPHLDLNFRRFQPEDPNSELIRFESALAVTAEQLRLEYSQALLDFGPVNADIFRAHQTILTDPDLLDGVKTKIVDARINAEAALYDVSEVYCQQLEAMEDEYIRARAIDIQDVRNALLAALLGLHQAPRPALKNPAIVISQFLTPSDCISLDRGMVLGFCTVEGGTTSHVAILARSLGVPAIAAADRAVLDVPAGDIVILDGDGGRLLDGADRATVAAYAQKQEIQAQRRETAMKDAAQPAETLDGHRVHVLANLGTAELDAVASCLQHGAEGVGLLRTEFVYLECARLPDEESQYQKYRAVVDAFGERPVILRTIDIGGDKDLPYLPLPHEANPFLGVRGLRMSLAHPDLFKTQLRAALRAGHGRNLLLMYPMVTKASEIRRARALLDETVQELAAASIPFATEIQVGIMVEVPAAALLADQLADEVDFFSIGTNDLSQYTMAMDRTNTELSGQVDALDPSVLRLIAGVIRASHLKGKKTGVCGELAGEPLAIPVLLGLDLDEFSMNAPAIPTAKRIIRRLMLSDAREAADAALKLESADQVRSLVRARFPDLQDEFDA